MTRRILIALIFGGLGAFYIALFVTCPWYIALGVLLGTATAWGALVAAELRWGALAIELQEQGGEEMEADGGDLWSFPPKCHEAEDRYDERRAA